jgi:hypothetical protein
MRTPSTPGWIDFRPFSLKQMNYQQSTRSSQAQHESTH